MIYIKGIFLLVLTLGIVFFTRPKDEIRDEKSVLPEMVRLTVPFTAQAPTGNWDDVKQGNGCEEASILMTHAWVMNQEIDKEWAVNEISKMSDFSLKLLGHFHDISNEDTIRLFKEYFKFENLFLDKNDRYPLN